MKKVGLMFGIFLSLFLIGFVSALENYEVVIPQTPGLVWTNQDVGANCEFINSSILNQYNPMNTPVSVPLANKSYLDKFFELYNYEGRAGGTYAGWLTDRGRFMHYGSTCFISYSHWNVPNNATWQKVFSNGYDSAVSSLGLKTNQRYWTSNLILFGGGNGVLELYMNDSSKRLNDVMSPAPTQEYQTWNNYCQSSWNSNLVLDPTKAYSGPSMNSFAYGLVFPGFFLANVSCPLALYRYVRCENENVPQCVDNSTYTVCANAVFKNTSCASDEHCSQGRCACNVGDRKCSGSGFLICNLSGEWENKDCSGGKECKMIDNEASCQATCFAQGGNTCSEEQRCDGTQIATDEGNERCCSGNCVMPAPKKCSDCGAGIFNLCDENECNNLVRNNEGCIFIGNVISGNCILPENCLNNEIFDARCVGKQVCSSGNCKNLVELKSCYYQSQPTWYSPLNSDSYYLVSKNLLNTEYMGYRGPCMGISSSENIVINGMGHRIILDAGSSGPLNFRIGILIENSQNILVKNIELDANSSSGTFYQSFEDAVSGVTISNSSHVYLFNNTINFSSSNLYKVAFVGVNISGRYPPSGDFILSNNSIYMKSGIGINYNNGYGADLSHNHLSMGSGNVINVIGAKVSSLAENFLETYDGTSLNVVGCSSVDHMYNNTFSLDNSSMVLDQSRCSGPYPSILDFDSNNTVKTVHFNLALVGFRKNVTLLNFHNRVSFNLTRGFDEIFDGIKIGNYSVQVDPIINSPFYNNSATIIFNVSTPIRRESPSKDLDMRCPINTVGNTNIYINGSLVEVPDQRVNYLDTYYYTGRLDEYFNGTDYLPSSIALNNTDLNGDCMIDNFISMEVEKF